MESLATRALDKAPGRLEARARQNPTGVLKQIQDPSSRRWFQPAIQTLGQWPQNPDNVNQVKYHLLARMPRGFQLAQGMCVPGFL